MPRNAKANQPTLEKPMAKKNTRNKRAEQNTTQNDYRKSLISSENIQIWPIRADGTRQTLTKKNCKIDSFVLKSLLESISKSFRNTKKTRKPQLETWPTDEEKPIPIYKVTNLTNKNSAASNFLHLCLNNICRRYECISKSSSCF